jgi:CheY-like chemotaxis protein
MKKVLLASASRVFLKKSSSLLSQRGFQLVTLGSGDEALRLHEQYHFDLILADLQLEDMSGCTLCSLVRREEKVRRIPIILICHNISGSISRVEQSGASAMLIKPIEPVQLLETIGSFIDLQMIRSKRVMLNVKVLSKKSDLEFYCFSHDISKTGILLESEYELEVGSRITCEFALPGSHPVEIEGEVIRSMNTWECKNLYGIKFNVIPAPYRREIDNFVALNAGSVAGGIERNH